MTTIVPQVACPSCGALMSKFRVRSHPRSVVCALYRAYDAGHKAGVACAPGDEPAYPDTPHGRRLHRTWTKGYLAGREVRYARSRAAAAARATAAGL